MSLSSYKNFDGKKYKLYDAYPDKKGAKRAARDYRDQPDPMWLESNENVKYYARVEDGGAKTGRLRYGLYVRLEVLKNDNVVKKEPSGYSGGIF